MIALQKFTFNIFRQGITKIGSSNIAASVARSFHLISSSQLNVISTLPKVNPGFLKPVGNILIPNSGFKVKGHLKRRCKDCYFVMRQQRLYVICKTHPRHKQMSMKARDDKSWILTHATQSKIRPY